MPGGVYFDGVTSVGNYPQRILRDLQKLGQTKTYPHPGSGRADGNARVLSFGFSRSSLIPDFRFFSGFPFSDPDPDSDPDSGSGSENGNPENRVSSLRFFLFGRSFRLSPASAAAFPEGQTSSRNLSGSGRGSTVTVTTRLGSPVLGAPIFADIAALNSSWRVVASSSSAAPSGFMPFFTLGFRFRDFFIQVHDHRRRRLPFLGSSSVFLASLS